jgi:antitoxin VapB
VTRDGDEVIVPVNEAARLEAEELGGLGTRFRVIGWEVDRDAELPRGDRVGADSPIPGRRDVSGALEAARRSLTEDEQGRFRALGRDCAEALTGVALALEPAASEHAAAAAVGAALLERAIDPIVLLVAGEARVPVHRHPLPTDAPVGRLVMLVVCGRRHGLIASLTRFVAFGGLPPELREAYGRLLRVDVAFNAATRLGETVGAAFAAGTRAYGEHGFDPEEWRLHHQGGPTGYEPRDYLATAAATAVVEEHQAFAWNPSVASLKCEDTILATSGLPEVLTADPAWPTETVSGLARPLVLER